MCNRDVFGSGDGGVGVFVGGGSKIGYVGSAKENSDVFSEGKRSVDSSSEDSDDRDGLLLVLVLSDVDGV